jgi:hypothetical protein
VISAALVSPKLAKILRSVRNNTVRSRISWDLWWAQEGADERPKHLEPMNLYSEFFRFDAHAHLTATITGTYRLYDKRSDVRSLRTLIVAAQAVPTPLLALAAGEAATLVGSTDNLVDKVATLRHKAFGHTDLARTYDEVFEAAEITPFQLRSLLETALKVLNTFERVIKEPETEFNDQPLAHFRQLMRFLRDHSK